MPIQIKARRDSGFADPIGLLNDCHRRIEHFLSLLVRISAQACGGPMTSEMQDACRRSLDYFRDAAPRHTQDEEESLFPRLRHMNDEQAKHAMQQIGGLETDHENAARWHDEVERIGRRWLADGTLPPQDAAALDETLALLTEMYREHILVEEQQLFPIAAAVLSKPELIDIGGEMAKRRNINFAHFGLTTISPAAPHDPSK